MAVFLGIDIGTTAIKIGVIQSNQVLYASEHRLQTYGDDTVKYQKGHELLMTLSEAVLAIPNVFRQQVETISFSTAMHSLMPDDESKKIFLWSDFQAAIAIEAFKKTNEAPSFYEISGTPLHAMSPFAKILALRSEYPQDIHWYGIKELVLQYFTGKPLIDYSTASATGLFDIHKRQWSKAILTYLKIEEAQLGELVDPTQLVEALPEICQKFGFKTSVSIMAGASDGVLAAYASFYRTGRTASLTIGTSAAVRQVTRSAKLNYKKQNFCYYLNEHYYVCGAPSNNGGCILSWAAEQFGKESLDFFANLPDILAQTEIGAKNLRFWPFLNGERAPYWSNDIAGGFQDLTLQHQRKDMIRSIIEGLLLNVARLVKLVAPNEELSISGGFFQTAVLGELAADIFGSTCYYAVENEPIFGLYYLLEQPELPKEKAKQIFRVNQANYNKYQAISKKYFEEIDQLLAQK
ncbi:gluconokinase [Enterococcus hermanniensis]|uniref:Gluconokinase n=1 Tax=Enterococcus hermanniensis TaxID=249189 RepID=A0A1L8TR74_9ENTE|nr:FGGY family carbohydrate kinase [Enterococcus hermanniensis]OJG46688.1 hypothetical protein RV04_GL001116 [Enterococcus hermanniensis]